MTPWRWWAREIGDDSYGLEGDEPSREAVILKASRALKPGDQFEIIEARSSEDMRHEGSDCVPFLRTRNHEIITVGPVPAASEGSADA